MFIVKDCKNMNMSQIECEIYHALRDGGDAETVRTAYGMTEHQFIRIVTSIERKLYLTKQSQTKRAENENGTGSN